MGRVVFLSETAVFRRDVWSGPSGHAAAQTGLTTRDRAALDAWARDGRRAIICYDELGTYAMLYEAGRSWASWGIVRRNDGVLLWDCVTHADIDTFPSVAAALFATGQEDAMDVGRVIPFVAERSSRRVGG